MNFDVKNLQIQLKNHETDQIHTFYNLMNSKEQNKPWLEAKLSEKPTKIVENRQRNVIILNWIEWNLTEKDLKLELNCVKDFCQTFIVVIFPNVNRNLEDMAG